MTIRRLCQALLLIGVAAIAASFPSYNKEFKSTYALKKNGTLTKSSCAACHIGKTKKLNTYGLDLKDAKKRESAKTLTGSVLKKVEALDSDKDGKTNLQEIEADTFPGDPKSKK
jgi:hypothetical protein